MLTDQEIPWSYKHKWFDGLVSAGSSTKWVQNCMSDRQVENQEEEEKKNNLAGDNWNSKNK